MEGIKNIVKITPKDLGGGILNVTDPRVEGSNKIPFISRPGAIPTRRYPHPVRGVITPIKYRLPRRQKFVWNDWA